ncbi:hypothetical protein ACWDR9_08360, partial [Streptosporangium sandarakinum]
MLVARGPLVVRPFTAGLFAARPFTAGPFTVRLSPTDRRPPGRGVRRGSGLVAMNRAPPSISRMARVICVKL